MCALYVHYEEPLSLDVTPNPNYYLNSSRSFQTLSPSRPLQTILRPMTSSHMTSRSRVLFPLQTNNNYYCLFLSSNPNPKSLSTHSSYNSMYYRGCVIEICHHGRHASIRDCIKYHYYKEQSLEQVDLAYNKFTSCYPKSISKLSDKQTDIIQI